MTKLEFSFDVPDQLASAAREAGLLAPEAMTELLQAGVRQKALERMEAARKRAGPGRPMSLKSIQKIVDSVRKERA